ncbi:MAG: lipopolysaccharide assembly LapA domain-containing protein [Anaerolineales bacterium]
MKYVYIALLIILVTAIAVFGFQNRATVTVSFFSWSTTLPLSVIVIGAYLLGMASGGTVAGFLRHSIREASKRPGAAGGGMRE